MYVDDVCYTITDDRIRNGKHNQHPTKTTTPTTTAALKQKTTKAAPTTTITTPDTCSGMRYNWDCELTVPTFALQMSIMYRF